MIRLLIVVAIVHFLFPLPAKAAEKPLRVVGYKNMEVSCFVEIMKDRFVLKADHPYGYEGRTIQEIVLRKNGEILSNKNYIFRRGEKSGREYELKYYYFPIYCYRANVTHNIPMEVRGLLGDTRFFMIGK